MKNLIILLIILISSMGLAQQSNTIEIDRIGVSLSTNLNINHKDGTFLQDIKKSALQIFGFDSSEQKLGFGTGVLLNTVKNTFSDSSQKYYIITANHVLANTNMDPKHMYISFEYEMANSTNRGTSQDVPLIAKVYQIPMDLVLSDPISDLALLEVNMDNLTENQKTVFRNAYAAGWTTNPSAEIKNYVNISHPRGDHKKVFTNPSYFDFNDIDQVTTTTVKGPNLNFKLFGPDWNNTDSYPQIGSSGSAMYDVTNFKNLVAGISVYGGLTGVHGASLLENSWKLSGTNGLQYYLDSDNTWMSKIPGGYINNLIENDEATDFELTLGQASYQKELKLNIAKFFNIFENIGKKKEDLLGSGIVATSGTDKVYLTVALKEDPDYLLYGIEYNPSATNNATIFQGNYWDIGNSPMTDIPGSSNDYSYWSVLGMGIQSSNMKEFIVEYSNKKLKASPAFQVGLKDFIKSDLDVEAKLQRFDANVSTDSKIKAIKLPKEMPLNAVEFFEPSRFVNMWRSKAYKESRGIASGLYINKVTKGDNIISTENNGGYLNMVNNNYTLGTINTSTDSKDEYLDISIDVATDLVGTYYYKAWVDFTPNVDTNYNYNFVDAGENENAPELIGKGDGTGNASTISIHYKMPKDDALGLQSGQEQYYRMRIAVSSQDNVQQDGIYDIGEVEDYQILVKSSAIANRSVVTNEINKLEEVQNLLAEPVLFPNPATDIFSIIVPARKSGTTKISILDLTGKLVYEKIIELNEGGNHIIELRDVKLETSTYVLKIVANNLNWSTKLVIK